MIRFFRNFRQQSAFALFFMVMGTAGGVPAWPAPEGLEAAPAAGNEVSSPATPLQAQEPRSLDTEPLGRFSSKQKRDYMKSNFEKMKIDADELVVLAKSLQEELSNSNVNLLSLKVVEKAEKIEKLAKKIKSVAKGY